MDPAETAARVREVVFAGHSVAFESMTAVRHRFGLRLIHALALAFELSENCWQHAMLVWTISVARTAFGSNLESCVACLVVCAKMHASCVIGLSKYVYACRQMFHSREQTSRALEWTLQQTTGALELKVHYLAQVLKMFDSADLANEVSCLTVAQLKHAEVFLLFTSINGKWYHYLVEIDDYLRSKTASMSSAERTSVLLDVCSAQDSSSSS